MYDLAIIGLGIAGLEALKMAVKHNLKVIAFEKKEIGGKYLNTNHIATKSIIYTTELQREINSSSNLGLNLFSKLDCKWSDILTRKAEIYYEFNKQFKEKYQDKITLVQSEAEIYINDNEVQIFADDNIYIAKHIIVATGSTTKPIKGLEIDNSFILNTNDLYKMQTLPNKVAIIGAGARGIEWAKILSNLNVNVKLIEQKESCAPKFDIDIQKGIEEVLRKNKVEIYKNNSINRISNNIIYLQSGDSFEVDCILCTNDKLPKLPKTKINGCNEEFILKTINDYSTEIDNLYVIGDANTNTKTPHEGKHQAWGVISKILFDNSYKLKEFPMLIQGNPEVASLGIREQDIIKKEKYKIKKHNITENLEALCENDTEGFIKLIISENTIKGAHIISKNASQLITLLSILIENKINIKRIETSSFLHLPAAKVITELLQS